MEDGRIAQPERERLQLATAALWKRFRELIEQAKQALLTQHAPAAPDAPPAAASSSSAGAAHVMQADGQALLVSVCAEWCDAAVRGASGAGGNSLEA